MAINLKLETDRVSRQIAALRHLPQEHFRAGESAVVGIDPLSVLISAGLDPTNAQRHFIRIGAGLSAPPVTQHLACGILATDRRLVSAKRTDRNGQFVVDLPAGEFSLRPVLEVCEEIDVEILRTIGDAAADQQLEAACRVDIAPSDAPWILPLRRAGLRRTAAAPERLVGRTERLAAATQTATAEPTSYIDLDRRAKCALVKCPADRVPFGIVQLVLWDRASDTIRAARVVSLPKRKRTSGDVRLAVVGLADWPGATERETAPGRADLCLRVVPAMDSAGSLRHFAPLRDQIAAELKKVEVQHDPEQRGAIESLLQRLDTVAHQNPSKNDCVFRRS